METVANWGVRPVFITSTFQDMQAERDWLWDFVAPAIEARLRAHRRHLEWIDLRLGAGAAEAETEAEREAQVLKVCLEEVRRSRPFLIALIGDRYGWVPPQDRAEGAAREAGISGAIAGHSVTELEIDFGAFQDLDQRRRSLFFLRGERAVLDGALDPDPGMLLDPQSASIRTHRREQIFDPRAARANESPKLPLRIVGFQQRSPTTKPVELRVNALAQAHAMLAAGDAAGAAVFLTEAPPSPGLANARAVSALRLGQVQQAINLLHPSILPNGARSPPETIPDAGIITYATALALAGDPRGAGLALERVKDARHSGVTRLRDALDAWRKSLSWKEAARYRLGGAAPRPVTLDFTPGELR
jgi:hypothetical protein